MKNFYILLLLFGCVSLPDKQPEKTVIYVYPDGTSQVFYKIDSIATVVNLNPMGEMMDSTWMITGKPLDSIIKLYKK